MDIEQLAGTRLGNYEIESLLGRGGMGVVYKALQISLDRPVALKILPPKLNSYPSCIKWYHGETQAIARLSNIRYLAWVLALATFCLSCFAPFPVYSETLTLKNGKVYEGESVSDLGAKIGFKTSEGKYVLIKKSDIENSSLEGSPSGEITEKAPPGRESTERRASGLMANDIYYVFGGNVFIDQADGHQPEEHGYVKLGSAGQTETFSGSYPYYIILTRGRIACVDSVRGSNGKYYGSTTGSNTPFLNNISGPPDGQCAVVGGSFAQQRADLYRGRGYILIDASRDRVRSITVCTCESCEQTDAKPIRLGPNDFSKWDWAIDMPLPEPHRVDVRNQIVTPYQVPIRPEYPATKAAAWAETKIFETVEVFHIQNRSSKTRDILLDIIVCPTTPWQEVSILSSTLPIKEFFFDIEGNGWIRVHSGPTNPGGVKKQRLHTRFRVATMSLDSANELEKSDISYPPEVARFLSDKSLTETRLHESKNADLQSLARQITSNRESNYTKAKAIYWWMREHIRYALLENVCTALDVLHRRKGSCGPQARLFVSLCRIAGVPARGVSGYNAKHDDGSITTHAWAEFYVAGFGWVPVDTSTSRFASSSPLQVTKSVGNRSYRQLIPVPNMQKTLDMSVFMKCGAVMVVNADGAPAPDDDWGLVSLKTSVRIIGSSGLTIKQVQQILASLGYDPGPVDGIWGEKTAAGLREFQRKQDLPVTGRLDDSTMSLLNRQSK